MKPTTKYWGKFESKGYPDFTIETGEISNGDMIQQIAAWLLKVKMNDKIVITLGVTEDKLNQTKVLQKSEQQETIANILSKMIAESADQEI